jgi:Flp pilus assembly pilin Flp
MRQLIRSLARERDAQDLIEYALMASVIALGVLIAMHGAVLGLNTQYTAIGTQLTGASGADASGGAGNSGSGGSGNNGNGNNNGNNGHHAGGGNSGNGQGNQ